MATSGIGGIGTNYGYGYNTGYNNGLDYDSWVNNATDKADKLKDQYTSTDSTSGTSGSKDTSSSTAVKDKYGTAATTSAYLRNYQMALEDLEKSSSALNLFEKDNVFAKYEQALAKADEAAKSGDANAIKNAQDSVEKAFGDMVSSIEKFVDDYNSTMSFLKNNNGMTATAADDMASFERSTLTDKALQTFGLSKDKDGFLSVDKKKLTESLEGSYEFVKETMGGQYGIAERVGTKATRILDSPVDRILGTNSTQSSDETKKNDSTSSSTTKASSSKSSMTDQFSTFANFAKSGAFNLTNYYAVGMLLNTIG